MKIRRRGLALLLSTTAFATCFTGAARAAGEADAPPAAAQGAPDGHTQDGVGAHGGPGGISGPHDFGGHGPGAPGPEMPFDAMGGMRGMHGGVMGHLHGLHLSEAQQDKLFAIHHAAAPEEREHMKAIRKAHEALAELAHADRFDDPRASALARELGQAIAAEALLQARTQAQALAVLTPEQREQMRRRRTPGPQMRPGAEPPHGPQDPQAPRR